MDAIEKAWLEEKRKTGNFLPKYSEYYFEKKKSRYSVYALAFGCLAFFTSFHLFFGGYNGIELAVWTGLDIFAFLGLAYYLKLNQVVNNYQKTVGYLFEQDSIVKVVKFSEPIGYISYDVLESEIENGAIRYASDGLVLGKGFHKLVFPYEVGFGAAKKQVKKCHSELQKHLSEKLPPFENKSIGLLDRRYCYKKNIIKYVLLLFVAMFCSRFIIPPDKIKDYSGVVMMVFIYGFWEYLSIYFFFINAVLYQKNQRKLKAVYEKYPVVKLGNENMGYVTFAAVMVLLLSCNISMLF